MEAKPPRRTRERILELSLKLFNDIGEPNVTTTTIAEEMEISPGNLYYHFRNKDDIINSIFAQFEQQIEKRLRFPDDHRPTIDEMWSYLQYMADFLWTLPVPVSRPERPARAQPHARNALQADHHAQGALREPVVRGARRRSGDGRDAGTRSR